MELPGFVYDSVRKRYFRVSAEGPGNNFNVPVERLLPQKTQDSEIWLDPDIRSSIGTTDVIGSWQSSHFASQPDCFRKAVAGYHHRYLRKLGNQVLNSSRVQFRAPSTGREAAQYGSNTVAVSSADSLPQVFFASEVKNQPGNLLELCLVSFKWQNGQYSFSEVRRSKFGRHELYSPTCSSVDVHGAVLRSGNLWFLSCTLWQEDDGRGKHYYMVETHYGVPQKIRTHAPAKICILAENQNYIATSTGTSEEVTCIRTEDMAIKGIYLANHLISSLAFVPCQPESLLVGTGSSKLINFDFRARTTVQSVVLSKISWDNLGIAGKCRITSVKALHNRNCFITTIGALPKEFSKMHMWDWRNLRAPFTVFDETELEYHSVHPPISVASDDTLAVASDVAGTVRFWDVNSGSLMARLPRTKERLASDDAPVAFYWDKLRETHGGKLLLLASGGLEPSLLFQNL